LFQHYVNDKLTDVNPGGADVYGSFGAICTTDANRDEFQQGGNVAIKYEDEGTISRGYTQYIVPSNSSTITGGAGHHIVTVDADTTLGIVTAPDLQVEGWDWYDDKIIEYEMSAWAMSMGFMGLEACLKWDDAKFCQETMAYDWRSEKGSRFPIFYRDAEPRMDKDGNLLYTSDWRESGKMDRNDLNQIGLFRTGSNDPSAFAGKHNWDSGARMQWLAKDDDCAYGAPQLVDLKNGRFLVGYGKFQCISQGLRFSRLAGSGKNLIEEFMRIPQAYYLMEIDKDGNVLVPPFEVDAGWGGSDRIVNFGVGKAAWAYVKGATIALDGSFTNPRQKHWELMVYESPYTP